VCAEYILDWLQYKVFLVLLIIITCKKTYYTVTVGLTYQVPVFVKGNKVTDADATDISIVSSPDLDLKSLLHTSAQDCESSVTIVIFTSST